MSSPITVYTFEVEGDESASDWSTQDVDEARAYAKEHGYSLIANEYEWSDSELVEDYRPSHALDGTVLEPEEG